MAIVCLLVYHAGLLCGLDQLHAIAASIFIIISLAVIIQLVKVSNEAPIAALAAFAAITAAVVSINLTVQSFSLGVLVAAPTAMVAATFATLSGYQLKRKFFSAFFSFLIQEASICTFIRLG
jgi:hypothetical protein